MQSRGETPSENIAQMQPPLLARKVCDVCLSGRLRLALTDRPAVGRTRIHKQAVNNLRVRQTEASIKSDLSGAPQSDEAARLHSNATHKVLSMRHLTAQRPVCDSSQQTDVWKGGGGVAAVGQRRKWLRPHVPRESASC